MDQRKARATTLAAVTLGLLVACGPGTTAPEDPVSPSVSSPRSTAAPTNACPDADPSADVVDPATPDSDDDVAAREQVRAATTIFVRTVLTIGYPDRTYRQYTDRIEPLMTTSGFEALKSAGSTPEGSDALASLYAQRSRSAPRFTGEVEVTSLQGDRATAQLAYENVSQRRDGRGWRAVKSLGEGTATVRLVRQGERWLVEDAS
jgi:hypothetical protein